MNRFQIMIETNNNAILFNTAEVSQEVDEFVDEFTNNKNFKSIKVYRFNEHCANYRLVHEQSRATNKHPIGFDRW